jgi:maltose alpha-D-glucosyltransferase / alpha-amylase
MEREVLWYKDAVIYQIHVRAFADSDHDGIGDFRGLTGKLDYLQDLGVTALWLLPFYPSPLRDDGYDIADYTKIHSSYGSLADFKMFLKEAHRRGLFVINEMVLNHTSDQHTWFKRARRAAPGSPKNTRKPASFLKISRLPTGAGTRRPIRITGTVSMPTSRT